MIRHPGHCCHQYAQVPPVVIAEQPRCDGFGNFGNFGNGILPLLAVAYLLRPRQVIMPQVWVIGGTLKE
jgi:hypothetical protein